MGENTYYSLYATCKTMWSGFGYLSSNFPHLIHFKDPELVAETIQSVYKKCLKVK